MPNFIVSLEREAKVRQKAEVVIEAPTIKEARIRAIEDDYGQAEWEDIEIYDWEQPYVIAVWDD